MASRRCLPASLACSCLRRCCSPHPLQEQELLDYLSSAHDLGGRPLYDPVHALRLARDRGRLRASVALFCEVRRGPLLSGPAWLCSCSAVLLLPLRHTLCLLKVTLALLLCPARSTPSGGTV